MVTHGFLLLFPEPLSLFQSPLCGSCWWCIRKSSSRWNSGVNFTHVTASNPSSITGSFSFWSSNFSRHFTCLLVPSSLVLKLIMTSSVALPTSAPGKVLLFAQLTPEWYRVFSKISPGTTKGPIVPEKLIQTNFPLVSPLQTVRTPRCRTSAIDHRGTAYRGAEEYPRTTSLQHMNDQPIHPGTHSFVYAGDLAVITQCTNLICTNRWNTDLSSCRTVGVLHHKPASRESDKDASRPLRPAESRIWQTAQHLERYELNPQQSHGVPWLHAGPNGVT